MARRSLNGRIGEQFRETGFGISLGHVRTKQKTGRAIAARDVNIRIGVQDGFDADVAKRAGDNASRDIDPAGRRDHIGDAAFAGRMARRLPDAGEEFEEDFRPRRRVRGDSIGNAFQMRLVKRDILARFFLTPERLAEQGDAFRRIRQRVDAEIDEDHRNAGLRQQRRNLAMLGQPVPGEAEDHEIGPQRQDAFGADALLRRLADERDFADFRIFRCESIERMRVHQPEIVLPADDALERIGAIEQGQGIDQPPFAEDHARDLVRHADMPPGDIDDFASPRSAGQQQTGQQGKDDPADEMEQGHGQGRLRRTMAAAVLAAV